MVWNLVRIARLKYGDYGPIIVNNQLKRILSVKKKHKFLFILSPPYCGSTLLSELISTSKSVSLNNPFGYLEGQGLPTIRNIMFDVDRRWDESYEYNWYRIKKEWMKYWDQTCPVLLEKSPPNIIRAQSIRRNFTPSYFIILYRNPYAQCQSLIKRKKNNPVIAAEFAIKCLRHQMNNILQLNQSLQLSYESLTDNPYYISKQIKNLVPELNDIQVPDQLSAYNYLKKKMGIMNLNHDKVSFLGRDEIKMINTVFCRHHDVLDFFNYSLMEED
ncbi:MAG: hypothetical protein KBA26_08180 [Candidatus Delongbacteria bacterium]|nr:hypothetical protein [Candidatus Delongbacteria bacterium]